MLNVDEIESGTVIDHITAGKGPRVLSILKISEDYPARVALVINATSKRMGKKDILKIESKFVSKELAHMIALVAPKASINVIKNGKVTEKYLVDLPQELKSAGHCPNPNCVTSMEKERAQFKNENDLYRCVFCERIFKPEEIV